MLLGLLGRKVGMTQVYSKSGAQISVTVVSADAGNRIVQMKTREKDGYAAAQVTYGTKKQQRVNKAMAGHFVGSGVAVAPGAMLAEFRLDLGRDDFQLSEHPDLVRGKEYGVEIFSEGDFVDVTGISKGKGYAGVIKRHNFATQDASHGNSVSHRAPGSIGQNQTPGKVFRGKKMAGHLGVEKCTVKNLEVIAVDKERNLLLIKGAIPGASTQEGHVIVRHVRLGKKKKKAS